MSQRRCALILSVCPRTVRRKLLRLSQAATQHQATFLESKRDSVKVAIVDEMETFEHTKCKPLSISVAVDEDTKELLYLETAQMPAKGHLAKISRKKYGKRPDHRPFSMLKLMEVVQNVTVKRPLIKSDQNPRYPRFLRHLEKDYTHETTPGRRGCVVGQGELKAGGWDPIFMLNHTCAMVQDNLKTLTRKTWCTVKRPDYFQALLDIVVCFYNEVLLNKNRLFCLKLNPI